MAKGKSSPAEDLQEQGLTDEEQAFTVEPRQVREADRIRKSEEQIESILGTVIQDGTHYLKIYKVRPLPAGYDKAKFLMEIMDPSSIDDLEIFVRDRARENNWGSGEYMVMVFGLDSKTGRKLFGAKYPPIKFHIDIDSHTGNPNVPTQANIIEDLNRYKLMRETFGSSSPPSIDINNLSKTMSDTLKTGLELAVKGDNKGDGADTLKTLQVLKEIGVIKKDEGVARTPSEATTIIQLLAVLKDIGIVGGKREEAPRDIWGEIAKMKELGLIPSAVHEKEDVISTATKLKELITVIQPLISGGGSDSVSFGVELIRTLGPHIPDIVKDITTTINNAVEISRLRRGEMAPMHRAPPPPQVEHQRRVAPKETGEPSDLPTNPFLREIYDAMVKKDDSFFPEFKQRMLLYSGEQALDYLLKGAVSIETYLGAMSAYTGPWIKSDFSREYVKVFLEWERTNRGESAGVSSPTDDEEVTSAITGKCTQCGAEYDYVTEVDYNDQTSTCDCGGKILLPT